MWVVHTPNWLGIGPVSTLSWSESSDSLYILLNSVGRLEVNTFWLRSSSVTWDGLGGGGPSHTKQHDLGGVLGGRHI